MKWLASKYLRLRGWTFTGELPDLKKMIIIGAPHTSNWDFVLFLGALVHFDMKVTFIGKHTLFKPPFGWLFRRWGGLPVDRSKPGGLVKQVADAFEAADRMILVMAPEGTRKRAKFWKAGFIWIAGEAGVPVVCAGVDHVSKTVEMGPTVEYDGDVVQFMDQLRSFYDSKPGWDPAGKGPVRVAEQNRKRS